MKMTDRTAVLKRWATRQRHAPQSTPRTRGRPTKQKKSSLAPVCLLPLIPYVVNLILVSPVIGHWSFASSALSTGSNPISLPLSTSTQQCLLFEIP